MPRLPVPLFVVPRDNVSTLCSVEEGKLVATCPLPMPALAQYAISESGWIAWAEDPGATIHRAHTDAEPHEQRFPVIHMPTEYKAAALTFAGPALYVGGACGTEVLGLFAIDEPEPAWVPLPIPEAFRREGKRVDDLLVDGTRLIAVDDIVLPQYLLLYDVTAPLAPTLVEVKELPWHTTYEHIERGVLGASFLALLSAGVNHGNCTVHVAFYDRSTLAPLGSISARTNAWHSPRTQARPTRAWPDLAWCDDVLILAAASDGVGVLDLSALGRPSPMVRQGYSWHEVDDNRRFMEECDQRLRYVSVPGGNVVRLTSVPGTRHVLAVLENDGKHNTTVLDVDALLA